MSLDELLQRLFPSGCRCEQNNNVVAGWAQMPTGEIAVLGAINGAQLDPAMALMLAGHVVEALKTHPGCPILLLVDTGGQKVSRHAELIGMNRYYAHLISCLALARQRGHNVVALVYGSALGGALIATGFAAQRVFGLPEAKIAVMWLEAMARVTKMPLEKLQALSRTSAIFAPGVANYIKLGAVQAVWQPETLPGQLQSALTDATAPDWRELGRSRGGRTCADRVVRRMLEAP